MKTIRLRGSSLDTFATCQRKFIVEWLMTAEPEIALEWGLRRKRPHVGAIVGRGVHAGVAYLMQELKDSGIHGGMRRVKHAQAASGALIASETKEPIESDPVTPTPTKAVKAASKIIERYHHDVRPDSEPTIVEQGLSMVVVLPEIKKEVEVTGTLDRYHIVGKRLRDCKTGKNKPGSIAQQGCYSLLLRHNGYPVGSVGLDYAKRVKEFQPQPAIQTMLFEREEAEQHAIGIIKQAATLIYACLKKGDFYEAIANPGQMNLLCSPSFCQAYDTPMCRVGCLLKG